MFRHEKTFYNKPGIFIRFKASDGDIAKKAAEADAYTVNYVGMDFTLDGFAIEADGGDFARCRQSSARRFQTTAYPDR